MGIKKKKGSLAVTVVPVDLQSSPIGATVSTLPATFGVHEFVDSSGQSRLTAVYPAVSKAGKPLRVELSFLLKTPYLRKAFEDAIVRYSGSRPAITAIEGLAGNLKTGFIAFLDETERSEISVIDFNLELINAYIQWLNQLNGNSARWAVITRYQKYSAFTNIVEQLREIPEWRDSCEELFLPKNVWPGIGSSYGDTPILDSEVMRRMRRAAMKEVAEIIENFNRTESALQSFSGQLRPFSEFQRGDLQKVGMQEFLVRLNTYKKDGYLTYTNIPLQMRSIAKCLGISVSGISHWFYATPRTMVPFVLLFGIAYFFNADTLRNIKLEDFKYDKGLGNFFGAELDIEVNEEETLAANAKKGRSKRRQRAYVPVDDEIDNPAVLFEFIKRWTAEIRQFAVPTVRNNLFLYATPNSVYRISSYHGIDGTSMAENWRGALALFCKDHEIESFTLQSVRKTALDVAFELFDGDPKAVGDVANHAHVDTTIAYMSGMERVRNMERLGTITQIRNRSFDTGNKVDYRDFPDEQDIKCATPGWRCADPNDSPFSEKDKLCSAYGFCPVCELGTPDFNSPLSYAYSINLLDAINRGQVTMSPENWLVRLGPIKQKLQNFWLPGFPGHVVEEAKKIDIPQMPSPE